MELKPGYKQTEVGVIPEDWIACTLSALATMKSGESITSTNIDQFSRYPCYGGNGLRGYTTRFTHDGCHALIGRQGALCGNVLAVNGQFFASEHAIVVTASPHTDISWLTFVLGKMNLNRYSESSAQPGLSVAKILSLPVGAPPQKAEQTAIAAALSDVDGLLIMLDRLIAKRRDLKQAAMQQLLTGRNRLPGFTGGWEVKPLGDCLSGRPDYGINAPAVPYSDRLPAYVRITDITEDGRFSHEKLVSVDSAESSNYYLSDGDIVFARTGASVGKSYRYNLSDGPLVFAGFLIRVRSDKRKLLPAFLAAYITTDAYWNWVRLMSTRSGQPGINGNEYSQMPIPIPPLSEQIAIAAVLSDMDSEIAALEARRDKTRLLKQGMMQELLTGRTRLI